MPKPALSLEAYAAEHPRNRGGIKCWACSIPEAKEINESRKKGRSLSTILAWLQDVRGHGEATMGKLEGHFVNSRHHMRSERGRLNG